MERAEDIFQRILFDQEGAIDMFIVDRKAEELFLDFKRSADNGSGTILHPTDRRNLGKAISGFGNSNGGVIVWGVDCSPDTDLSDVAHTKVPIHNVTRFVSWLEGAVSGCTIPPHSSVRNDIICKDDSGNGFAITYVPTSLHAPHQDIARHQYYIRAGSSFVPTPHAVLAGMFGRRPQPYVFNAYAVPPATLSGRKVRVDIGLVVRNNGPGIAKDAFLNVWVVSIPGPQCELFFGSLDDRYWMGQFSFGRHTSLITRPEVRMPPESQLQPTVLTILFEPPFENKLSLKGVCGCSQSPSWRFTIDKDEASIGELYDALFDKISRGTQTEADMRNFSTNMLPKDGEEAP